MVKRREKAAPVGCQSSLPAPRLLPMAQGLLD
jgi:hypothetical protein